MTKKLNIAFVWHFHQPSYQENAKGDFLMPWVRLHATKDYLDMLLRLEDFKNIKLNFKISPVLLESVEKYIKEIEERLQLLCESKLPDFKWPSSYECLDVMPLTPVAKIDIKKLQQDANEKAIAKHNQKIKK